MKTGEKPAPRRWKPWLLAGLYAAAVLIWLIWGMVNAALAAGLAPWRPEVDDFVLEGIAAREEPYADYTAPLVSTDADPQMQYPTPVTVNGVAFRLRGHLPTGTPALYYRAAGETAYHELYPQSYDSSTGEYIFTFSVLREVELRLDPVTTAGCIFELSDLCFNVSRPFWRYLVPDLDELVLLAVCPLLCFAAAAEIVSMVRAGRDRKKDKRE